MRDFTYNLLMFGPPAFLLAQLDSILDGIQTVGLAVLIVGALLWMGILYFRQHWLPHQKARGVIALERERAQARKIDAEAAQAEVVTELISKDIPGIKGDTAEIREQMKIIASRPCQLQKLGS